ncbi:type II secretion system F family protein [Planctomicrobium sp. SH661]|uniref:type II secretion system F family protein n=1 Tax=Planctomicrobium sp. SH661 TaxID=3448124 RepID=UPI003F5B8469
MPQYLYQAIGSNGETRAGAVTSDSRSDAFSQLQSMGFYPTRLDEQAVAGSRSRKVPAAVLSSGFTSLADLMDSGVPLLRAIEVLQDQCPHAEFKSILSQVRHHVRDGRGLTFSLQQYPHLFGPLPISVIRAGEEGGFLEDSLRRVAVFTQRQEELKGKVLGAIAYPAFLAVVGTIVVVGMIVFFVPRFEPLFARLEEKGQLPWMTTVLLTTSSLLSNYGLWIIAGVMGVTLTVKRFCKGPVLRRTFDALLLRIPTAGPIIRGFAISRFCRVLGTLLSHGVPMLQSLEISRNATGNVLLSEAIAQAAQNVSAGHSLSAPLSASGEFPSEVVEMIRVAESSNRLESVLTSIAERLETQFQNRLDLWVKMLEPAMMLVMAAVIGFLVIALLLPVFSGSQGMV